MPGTERSALGGRCSSSKSDDHARAVESRDCEPRHRFVEAVTLLGQHGNRDFLSKPESRFGVRSPVDTRGVASERDVRRQLVELSADSQRRSSLGFQRQTVLSGDDGLFDWKRLVEERFQYRRARACHGGVSGRIRRMERCALGIGLR